MKSGYSPNRFNYNDPLLKRRRRIALVKATGGILAVVLMLIGGFYGLFFSPIFAITKIEIKGLEKIDSSAVRDYIEERMNVRGLGFIPWGKNIFFFNSAEIAKYFLAEYKQLSAASISRNFFHTIRAEFQERHPAGIWCVDEANCFYFDDEGTVWGSAAPSSGSLIVVVYDERSDILSVDKDFLKAIQAAAEKLTRMGLGAKQARIPEDSFEDFRIYTSSDTPVIMSKNSDIEKQLDILKTFLDQKAPPNFNPEYIDLRISGRIYYK